MKQFIIFITCFIATPAWAGIDSDMNNFFDSMGVNSNFTAAGRYNTQSGGYATGGSMFVRIPQRNYQLLHVTLPHLTVGCGGIDAYLGGFSFINKSQFTAMLRNIGNNALGYAFQLALATVSPAIDSVLKNLQGTIAAINKINFASCHAIQNLAEGIAGQMSSSSGSECIKNAIAQGKASDVQDATDKCNNQPGFKFNVVANALADATNKNSLNGHINVIWAGLSTPKFALMPVKIKEFLMSLTGTIITVTDKKSGTTDATYNMQTNISVNALINGSNDVTIFDCGVDTDTCLPPNNGFLATRKNVHITGLKSRVRSALDVIRTGLLSETSNAGVGFSFASLSADSVKFIGMSKLPFLKLMVDATALGPSIAMEVENALVEPVAFDIVASYVDWALTEVTVAAYRGTRKTPANVTDLLLNHIQALVKKFNDQKRGKNMMTATEIIQKAKFLDEVLAANMSPHFQKVFQYARGQ